MLLEDEEEEATEMLEETDEALLADDAMLEALETDDELLDSLEAELTLDELEDSCAKAILLSDIIIAVAAAKKGKDRFIGRWGKNVGRIPDFLPGMHGQELFLAVKLCDTLARFNMFDHACQQGGNREDFEAGEEFWIVRDAVCHNDFGKARLRQTFSGRAGEDAVRGCRIDLFVCLLVEQRFFGGEQCASRIDKVIKEDARFSFDVADDFMNFRLMMAGPALMQNGKFGSQLICKFLCALGAAYVRCHHDRIL